VVFTPNRYTLDQAGRLRGLFRDPISINASSNTTSDIAWLIEITASNTRLGNVAVRGWGAGINETRIWILDEANETGNLLSIDLITDDIDGAGSFDPANAGFVRLGSV